MRKSYLNLAGVTFEVVPTDTKKAQGFINTYNWYMRRYDRRTLFNAYKTPSQRKQDIYNSWLKDFSEIEKETGGCIMLSVLGASSNFFSIGAYDTINKRLFYITAGYNRVIEGVIL